MIQQRKPGRKLIIFTSYATIAMLGIYISLFQYTILNISQVFAVNAAMMGLMIGMQHFGMSVPPLFIGALCGRIGKKKVLLASYTLIIAGTFLVGIIGDAGAFIASVLIIGAGFSVTEATTSAVLADEFPDETTKHLNFSQVAFSCGALAGPLIAERLINSGVYFKDLYIYCSLIFFALYGLFMLTKHANDKGEPLESSCFKLSGFFKNRAFLLLALGIMLYVGVENTVANFADSYFEIAMQTPALSATALSLFWGAMIPSRFLAGIIKTDPKKIFASLSVLVFASCVTAMLIEDQTVKVIMFALCGFGCGPLWPLMMDAAAKKNRGASGPALNIMMAFSGFGGAIMPLMSGALVGFAGLASAFYFSAAVAVVMLFTYLASLKDSAAKHKDSESKSV